MTGRDAGGSEGGSEGGSAGSARLALGSSASDQLLPLATDVSPLKASPPIEAERFTGTSRSG